MIEAGTGVWATLAIGMLLGPKHATDADHVVAVATFATEHGTPGAACGLARHGGSGTRRHCSFLASSSCS